MDGLGWVLVLVSWVGLGKEKWAHVHLWTSPFTDALLSVNAPRDCFRSPYSITERRVTELIPVVGIQPAGDVSHKPGGRLLLLSVRPAVTPETLKRGVTNFAAW